MNESHTRTYKSKERERAKEFWAIEAWLNDNIAAEWIMYVTLIR